MYSRKFWKHGPFRWRFDDQPWQTVTRDVKLLDAAELRPTVGVHWVRLGDVRLSRGPHRFRLELLESEGACAFDAFVLSRSEFVPRGKLKPGESYPAAPSGWVTFDPRTQVVEASELDLRYLNQAAAGEDGFVQVAGSGFVFEKTDEPVRFWGINAEYDVLSLSSSQMSQYAPP